jgi:hypothetical protein
MSRVFRYELARKLLTIIYTPCVASWRNLSKTASLQRLRVTFSIFALAARQFGMVVAYNGVCQLSIICPRVLKVR